MELKGTVEIEETIAQAVEDTKKLITEILKNV